jgi:hypothetical protein
VWGQLRSGRGWLWQARLRPLLVLLLRPSIPPHHPAPPHHRIQRQLGEPKLLAEAFHSSDDLQAGGGQAGWPQEGDAGWVRRRGEGRSMAGRGRWIWLLPNRGLNQAAPACAALPTTQPSARLPSRSSAAGSHTHLQARSPHPPTPPPHPTPHPRTHPRAVILIAIPDRGAEAAGALFARLEGQHAVAARQGLLGLREVLRQTCRGGLEAWNGG